MRKQYVNLLFDKAKHHGKGVPLVATPQQAGNGAMSEWWVEPSGKKNTDQKYLGASRRAHMALPFAGLKRSDKKFHNVLKLPHVGGDAYKVKVSKQGDRANAQTVDEVETWRKFFYTVHWMNGDCERMFQAVKPRIEAAFKEGFIEFEYKGGSKTLGADEPRTRSSNTLSRLYSRNPPLPEKPFHLRVVVLNDIFDIEDDPLDATGWAGASVRWSGGEPLSDLTPTDWLKSARAQKSGASRWFDVRPFCRKVNDTDVEVDVSGHRKLNGAVLRGKALEFELVVRRRSHYEGHSIYNFCVVRIHSPGVKDQQANMLQTFTHEVGHGLYQVVRDESLYDAKGNRAGKEENPLWHDDRYGGRGDHCAKNAGKTPKEPAHPEKGGKIRPGWWTRIPIVGAKLCTMYYSSDDAVDPDGKFCDNCVPRLTRVDLGSSRMNRKGWTVS